MDSEWRICFCRHSFRFYAYILTSAKLQSTSIPTVLCTNYTDDSCVFYCFMVLNSVSICVEFLGWDIDFIVLQRIMNLVGMRMKVSLFAVL